MAASEKTVKRSAKAAPARDEPAGTDTVGMATYKKPASALYWSIVPRSYLQLAFEGEPGWIFGGNFRSRKKAVAGLERIRQRGVHPESYEIVYQKSGDHHYFTLRGPNNENLGGQGGFSSAREAREAIAYLAAHVTVAPFRD